MGDEPRNEYLEVCTTTEEGGRGGCGVQSGRYTAVGSGVYLGVRTRCMTLLPLGGGVLGTCLQW